MGQNKLAEIKITIDALNDKVNQNYERYWRIGRQPDEGSELLFANNTKSNKKEGKWWIAIGGKCDRRNTVKDISSVFYRVHRFCPATETSG